LVSSVSVFLLFFNPLEKAVSSISNPVPCAGFVIASTAYFENLSVGETESGITGKMAAIVSAYRRLLSEAGNGLVNEADIRSMSTSDHYFEFPSHGQSERDVLAAGLNQLGRFVAANLNAHEKNLLESDLRSVLRDILGKVVADKSGRDFMRGYVLQPFREIKVDTEFPRMNFPPDGRSILLFGLANKYLQQWDFPYGQVPIYRNVASSFQGDDSVTAYTNDGLSLLVIEGSIGKIKILSRSNLEEVGTLSPSNMSINFVSQFLISPDESLIAINSKWDSHSTSFWKLEGLKLSDDQPIEDRIGVKGIIAFASNGQFAVTRIIEFSPDSTRLAALSADNSLYLWDTTHWKSLGRYSNGTSKAALEPHAYSAWFKNSQAVDMFFSPDGKLLATTSVDQSVRIWSVNPPTLLHTLPNHPKVKSPDRGKLFIEFSAAGNYLLERFSKENAAYIWEPKSGSLVQALVHSGMVNSAKFTPDEQFVITGSEDETARVWRVGEHE
jgi:hypothetical protein